MSKDDHTMAPKNMAPKKPRVSRKLFLTIVPIALVLVALGQGEGDVTWQ
jgi:hypothetical protein